MTGVLIKGGNLEEDPRTHAHTHGEGHVKVKAEVGMMLLQAKERQRWPASHQQSGERPGADSVSHLSRRNHTF